MEIATGGGGAHLPINLYIESVYGNYRRRRRGTSSNNSLQYIENVNGNYRRRRRGTSSNKSLFRKCLWKCPQEEAGHIFK
jgi:hypothetical protein